MMSSSRAVLTLYKRILRLGKSWQAASGIQVDTLRERAYIQDEAKRLFRLNKNLMKEDIKTALEEGQSRLELALHYKNPWPRPTHIPQHTMLPPTSRRKKQSDKVLEQSKPVYIRSYNIGDQKKTE